MHRRSLSLPLVYTLAACATPLLANGALAQNTTVSKPDQSGVTSGQDELGEIIVTAEKREAGLQKTPVAITVVTQDAMVQAGVDEFESIQKVAPDVNITNNAAGPVINIRGLYTTQGNSPGAEGVAAAYFDGGYLTQANMQGLLFDLQRVEVDKGPQTTLFGKDAEAGAVNFISNKPVLGETSGQAQIEHGSYSLLRTEGVLNVPIGDTFAIRAAYQSYSHTGYMESGLDDAATQSGRVSALWKPNDQETLLVVGYVSTDNSRDDGAVVYNVVGVQPGSHIYVPPNPRDDTFYYGDVNSSTSPYYRHSQMQGAIVQNDFDAGFATWTTLLSFNHYDLKWVYPTDPGQGPNATAPDGGTYATAGRTYVPQHNQSEGIESRLASNSTVPFQWVGGIYLYQDVSNGNMEAYASQTTAIPSIQIGNPFEQDRTGAIFGQVTYTPEALSALHLTAGGRGESDYKEQMGTFTAFGPTPYPYNLLVGQSSNTWRAATYRGEVAYDITPTSLLYADTATAFRAGGYSYGPGANANPAVGPIFEPEHVTSYEIGLKNRFLDQRLQVNLEGWIYHYTNFENVLVFYACAPGGGACGGLPGITTSDAGRANYHGATVDIDYLVTPLDEVKLNYTWLYAKYGQYVQRVAPGYSLSPGPAVTTNDFLTDTYLSNVPHYSGIASYTHTWPNVLGGSIITQVAAQFQGSRQLDNEDDPVYGVVQYKAPSWVMADLSVRYEPQNSVWSVSAYVHNVANRLVPVAGSYSTTTNAFTEGFYPPRVVGVILSAKF